MALVHHGASQFRLSTRFRNRRHILIRGGAVMVSRVGGMLFGVRGSMAGLLSFTTQRATDSRSRQRPRQQDQDQRHRSCYLELHLPPLYLINDLRSNRLAVTLVHCDSCAFVPTNRVARL